jgi:glycosyltransferase involved in cell wall biosynthesis
MFALTSPVRGGVEEVVVSLARHLDPAEFRLSMAAPPALLEALGPDLAGVAIDTLAVQAERPSELPRLSRFIGAVRPDVVNPHLFRSTLVAAPLARWHRVPAVVETYHGREAWRGDGATGFLPDRVVARLVDRVIAVSAAAGEFLVTQKGYPASRVVVVPNGRDLTAFAPGRDREAARKELGLDAHTPVVAVVGRLETQKGHRDLLAAWPAVVAALPDARLLVVGDGSLRADLEAQARGLGVRPSIVFTGYRADVARLIDAADVLALPSLHEGMPLTAIEGAAMARPVVATAVDGTPEVVRHGVTGLLVPVRDVPALGRALADLLLDPARAAAMGQAARRRALERFDIARQVEATARVYRTSLGLDPWPAPDAMPPRVPGA